MHVRFHYVGNSQYQVKFSLQGGYAWCCVHYFHYFFHQTMIVQNFERHRPHTHAISPSSGFFLQARLPATSQWSSHRPSSLSLLQWLVYCQKNVSVTRGEDREFHCHATNSSLIFSHARFGRGWLGNANVAFSKIGGKVGEGEERDRVCKREALLLTTTDQGLSLLSAVAFFLQAWAGRQVRLQGWGGSWQQCSMSFTVFICLVCVAVQQPWAWVRCPVLPQSTTAMPVRPAHTHCHSPSQPHRPAMCACSLPSSLSHVTAFSSPHATPPPSPPRT